ncbi:uncharacterized protein [Physcomitrium patens]|uniref:uncharacterized protein isoform X2 n=1 Tax=Physcomitrium patens TaxID=3218 RepID=UPI003CCD45F6
MTPRVCARACVLCDPSVGPDPCGVQSKILDSSLPILIYMLSCSYFSLIMLPVCENILIRRPRQPLHSWKLGCFLELRLGKKLSLEIAPMATGACYSKSRICFEDEWSRSDLAHIAGLYFLRRRALFTHKPASDL